MKRLKGGKDVLKDFIINLYYRTAEVFICNRFGHKWIDDSHAGPDSGNISMNCTRCKRNYYKALY